jgi:hypothetical protein
MPSAPQDHLDLLLQYYPDDPTLGCPFDTGRGNILGKLHILVLSFGVIRLDVASPAIQADRGNPRRYRISWPPPTPVEIPGEQAEELGL